MKYVIPDQYEARLHHCRPRFKNNIEDVLLHMASEICFIGKTEHADFKDKLNVAIKLFPGNAIKAPKTINNWRTEISALLGLIEYDDNFSSPSKMAIQLNQKQDLAEFFKFFCFKFQYPGGHLKPQEVSWMLQRGIKFKPAKYVLSVLNLATTSSPNTVGLSKEEVTHCIFNDLRVTRDNRDPKTTLDLILSNRSNGTTYDTAGDVIRYAGDILDYMELANLLILKPNGQYYLKTSQVEAINAFLTSEEYFQHYDTLYDKTNVAVEDIVTSKYAWFSYANEGLDSSIFETDIALFLRDNVQALPSEDGTLLTGLLQNLVDRQHAEGNVTTKKIGDTGEAIAIRHEQIRLDNLDRPDLAKKVKKMPEIYGVGYDLHSYEGEDQLKRLIEVKTTISKKRTTINRFQMTSNEWDSADSFGERYYIYRLSISSSGVRLFIIHNPVDCYKTNRGLSMTPSQGAAITYKDSAGCYEELLI